MKAIMTVCAAFLLPGMALAQEMSRDLKQNIDQLQAVNEILRTRGAMAAGAPGSDTGAKYADADAAREAAGALSMVQNCVAQQNYEEAIRGLKRLLARPQPPELKKSLESLLVTLEKERAARQQQIVSRVDALIKRAAESCWKAQKSEELESIQVEFQEFRNEFNRVGNSSAMRRVQIRVNNLDSFLSRWAEYLDAVTDGNLRRALEIQRDFRSNKSYREVLTLFPAEAWKKRQRDMLAQAQEGLDKALAELPERVAKAKNSGELRQIQGSLDELSNLYGSDVMEGVDRKFSSYRNQLRQWTSVIIAVEQSNYRQALYVLREYENEASREGSLISQSAVEALRMKLVRDFLTLDNQVDRDRVGQVELGLLVEKMKTRADVEKVRQALQKLRSVGFNENGNIFWALDNDLNQLITSFDRLEDKQYWFFWQSMGRRQQPHPWEDKVDAIRKQLGLTALSQQFGLDYSKPNLMQGTLGELIDKQIEVFEKNNQWDRAYRLLLIYQRIGENNGGDTTQSIAAEVHSVRLYLEGQNLEDAGQWAEAVKAYQEAVRHVGERVPRAAIKARLEALAKSHPEAWKQ